MHLLANRRVVGVMSSADRIHDTNEMASLPDSSKAVSRPWFSSFGDLVVILAVAGGVLSAMRSFTLTEFLGLSSAGEVLGQTCQLNTIETTVPSSSSNVALQSYSYCGGTLNVTVSPMAPFNKLANQVNDLGLRGKRELRQSRHSILHQPPEQEHATFSDITWLSIQHWRWKLGVLECEDANLYRRNYRIPEPDVPGDRSWPDLRPNTQPGGQS